MRVAKAIKAKTGRGGISRWERDDKRTNALSPAQASFSVKQPLLLFAPIAITAPYLHGEVLQPQPHRFASIANWTYYTRY